MKKFTSLLVITFLLLSTACKKDKTKDILITIDPKDIHIPTEINKVIAFNIKAEADFPLVRFIIHYTESGTAKVTLLDSTISPPIKKFNHSFEFTIPETWAGKSVTLVFNAYDQEGNMGTSARSIVVAPVTNTPKLLTETTGHYFYSTHSGEFDAFDIETATPQLILTALPHLRDVQDYDTIPNDSIMQRSWSSASGSQFVRFNGFDYANATDVSTADAYNAGTKQQIINNIQVNDIIIVKTPGKYGVIRVTNIFDVAGVENDRYEFNLKRLIE